VWVHKLGAPPSSPAARERWLQAIATIAAYRVNDIRALGCDVVATDITDEDGPPV